jgi:hypothetical protein
LLEANRFAAAMTPHPCVDPPVATVCDVREEPCTGLCDGIGGDMNPYRSQGPGHELFRLVDPARPMTVRTRFVADEAGHLAAITQTLATFPYEVNTALTDEVVAAQKEQYNEENTYSYQYGGTAQMGAAMKRGMVLVLSIWDDSSANMNWLDSCTVAPYQTYNCSDHAVYNDPAMWNEAFKQDGQGAWRGPADYHKSLATSFLDNDISFANPAIPPGWRTQRKFTCDSSAGSDGVPVYDCSAAAYKVVVSDITVNTL